MVALKLPAMFLGEFFLGGGLVGGRASLSTNDNRLTALIWTGLTADGWKIHQPKAAPHCAVGLDQDGDSQLTPTLRSGVFYLATC